MDWSHLIAKLRRVALWIRVILATPFHLQRLKSSKVHLIALSPGTVFSFPYTREGKELKMRLLSSLAPASGCGAAPSGLLSETAGNTALLHLPALWQISTSHMLQEGSSPALQSLWEPSRTAEEAEQHLQMVSHNLPAFWRLMLGWDCLEENISCHAVCVCLHPRMSASNYWDAPKRTAWFLQGWPAGTRPPWLPARGAKGTRNRNWFCQIRDERRHNMAFTGEKK